jgi:hypothetical protein
MREIADSHGCLFVDLYDPFEGAVWLLNPDDVHYNDVGQRLIGHTVFAAVAANCSFVGIRSLKQARRGGFGITKTGGTHAKSEWISVWHENTGWLLSSESKEKKR